MRIAYESHNQPHPESLCTYTYNNLPHLFFSTGLLKKWWKSSSSSSLKLSATGNA